MTGLHISYTSLTFSLIKYKMRPPNYLTLGKAWVIKLQLQELVNLVTSSKEDIEASKTK